MNVTVNREGNDATLKITVPAADVAKGYKSAVQRIASQVKIPGFRPGKAPRNVIEMHYGKEAVKEEAFNVVVNRAYQTALTQEKLMPVSDPSVNDEKAAFDSFEEGKDLNLEIKVTLKPEPELGEYKGLHVDKKDAAVSDEDVDKALDELRNRGAKMVDTADDTIIEKGDFAVIDFAGTVDGEPFSGGEGKGYPLEVGSGSFIPGFEDQLVGLGKGESTDVNVTFPEDYFSKELAGKAAVFKVNVQDVKVKEVPEVTDELIAANSDSKTVAEFREKTLDRMKKAEAQRAQSAYEQELIETAVKNAKVDVPEVMVNQRANQMMDELAMNLESHKMSLPMYLQYLGKDVKTYRDEQKPVALQNIKTDLVLDSIALKEGVKVKEEEIKAELEQLAAMHGATLKQVEKIVKENGSLALLVGNIARRKAARVILDSAKKVADAIAPEEAKAETEENK